MRLIDADALLKEMDNHFRHIGRAEEVRDMINNLPTIAPATDWIPCAERLPKEDGRYWVTIVYHGNHVVCKRLFHSRTGVWVRTINVIAWMKSEQKPEPYRGDHIVDNKKVQETQNANIADQE